MAIYKRRWYHNIYFEFYLNMYLIRIETRLLREAYDRMAYDICRIRFQLLKWQVFEFQLYKRPML